MNPLISNGKRHLLHQSVVTGLPVTRVTFLMSRYFEFRWTKIQNPWISPYHAIYSPLFARREQREWSEKYLLGLLSNIERKSIEPMVLELFDATSAAVRGMQQFITKGTWEDSVVLNRHWQMVDDIIGCDDGVLIVDGSDFLKQGKESVGVKHQYCGEVGKTANCQAGVFVGLPPVYCEARFDQTFGVITVRNTRSDRIEQHRITRRGN